jgi:predicted ArsR family transcriptional regulator
MPQRPTTMQAIRAVIAADAPVSAAEIARRLGMRRTSVGDPIHRMRKRGDVWIAGWERSTGSGQMVPLYALGNGRDRPRPKPYSHLERCARYRERHRHTLRLRVRGETATWLPLPNASR